MQLGKLEESVRGIGTSARRKAYDYLNVDGKIARASSSL